MGWLDRKWAGPQCPGGSRTVSAVHSSTIEAGGEEPILWQSHGTQPSHKSEDGQEGKKRREGRRGSPRQADPGA